MRSHARPGTMLHKHGRIVLDLPIDEAEDLMHAFSVTDGFSRDLYLTIEEARSYIESISGGPGIRVVMTASGPRFDVTGTPLSAS